MAAARPDPRDTRSPGARYAVAVVIALAGVGATLLVGNATDEPVFTILIGVATVAAWFGGLGPGLVAIAVAWGVGWWAFADPEPELGLPEGADLARWLVGLVAAVMIVAVFTTMRRGRDRAATAADEAEASQSVTEGIQRLATALSAALTPSDVARELVEYTPRLVGATGGALALIEGSDLVVVDPLGEVEQTLRPGLRLPLSAAAPITRAARDGTPVIAADRASFRRDFPDGAELAPYAHGAVAVPLRVAGRVVGSMGFPFGRPDVVTESTLAVAQIAADLGGQALERAELYDEERSMRTTLDSILRAAPRLVGATIEEAEVAVCEEAKAMFGADIAQVWAVRPSGDFEVRCRRPEDVRVPRAASVSMADYPGLAEAVAAQRQSFVPDVQAVVSGAALEHALRFGIRSSLRIPVVVGGEISHVLILQWHDVIPGPSASQSLLLGRFADQAGLALEHAERRAAERVAARAAVETKRLLDVSSALSSAADLPGVAAATLHEAARSLGAQAGAVVLRSHPEDALETVDTGAHTSAPDPDPATLAVVDEAMRSGAPVVVRSTRELDALTDLDPDDVRYRAWLAIPLIAGGEVIGCLGLAFTEPPPLDGADLDFAGALGRQAGVAIERALRFESERTIAETLQQSVLPESLPVVDGVQMAARYLPGTAAVDVGGDWFDAIPLADGRLGLAVGDVVGKGVRAAATMAQLRNGLRAFALDQMKPSSTVSRLNRLTGEVDDSAFATLVYAVLDLERRVVRFTAAGHLPPVVVYPDRRIEFLEGGRSLPLGVSIEAEFEQEAVELPTGSTLLLFTDGLVERRDRPLTEGMELLRAAIEEGPGDPERLVDHVLDRLVGRGARGDDIAVLAVRLLAAAPSPLDLRLPAASGSLDLARDALRVWLEHSPLTEEEAHAVVLAAWEACANAVEHPQEARVPVFTLSARASDHGVTVEVADTGQWRDGRSDPDRGLGLHLMRSVMTAVEVTHSPSGTRVHMEKAVGGRTPVGVPS